VDENERPEPITFWPDGGVTLRLRTRTVEVPAPTLAHLEAIFAYEDRVVQRLTATPNGSKGKGKVKPETVQLPWTFFAEKFAEVLRIALDEPEGEGSVTPQELPAWAVKKPAYDRLIDHWLTVPFDYTPLEATIPTT